MKLTRLQALTATMFLLSFSLIMMELLLTRLFAIVLFAQFAHLALGVALLGISLGAVIQHLFPETLPEEGLERNLAWVALLQGVLSVLAVVCTLYFPVIAENADSQLGYGERSSIKDTLLNPGWFAALLPMLTLPFVAAGLAFAGAFQRRREHIGRLYGADLVGGAVGAVLFIPLLNVLAGPDVAFVVFAGTGLAAMLLWVAEGMALARVAGGAVVASLLVALYGGVVGDVLKVGNAAGFTERNVVYSEWTALTRVSLHVDDTGRTLAVLDNASRSEIFHDEETLAKFARGSANRTVVYELHEAPARVVVLAASAGPEVATAQMHGYTDVEAVDIAGEIFDVVAEHYPDSPVNPYVVGNTKRVKRDGRAAILHAQEPYDIIQMVHANLNSSTGLLADAWSSSLLETVEAFETYLDKLSDDGTISFGRGRHTPDLVRAAGRALRNRGVDKPHKHMAYIKASGTQFLLVKKRPWTKAERKKLLGILKRWKKHELLIDPGKKPTKKARRMLSPEARVMTDDRPYLDEGWGLVTGQLKRARESAAGERPLALLYRSIVVQATFVLVAGVLFVGLPFVRRGPTQLSGAPGVPQTLLYVCCLGYGYLAVETVLIHQLVLFVGHPTYAVTTVILAMLLFSGIGSLWVERLPMERVKRVLLGVLGVVIVLGLVQGLAVPPALHAFALGLPLAVRVGITFVVLAPLGFVMGMPFPAAMRMLRPEAGGIVPWAWALNGWMSVVASLVTVLLSRMYGYSYAFGVAVGAYVLALALAPLLPSVSDR